jgi:hypothetical protein
MIVRLSQAIPFNGGTIDHVTVRIPPETEWDANPPNVDNAIWNLSNAVGLPIDVVTQLAESDLEAIAAAFADVSSRWNVAASGAFTSHRAFRRRSKNR